MTDYNFNPIAKQYDASRAMPAEAIDRICQWVLSRLPQDPAIAEIGVGTGRIALPFIIRGVRYSGFDIATEMLDQLRAKLPNGDLRNARLHIANVTEHLPLDDHTQDAVIAVHIFHLIDAVKALHQVRRILKPHGAIAWGYQHHGDDSVRMAVRSKFYELAANRGYPRQREFHVPEARQLLAEWGAQVSPHTVAVWSHPETPREVLASLAGGLMSSTWHIPAEARTAIAAETEAWARAEYGDLDRSFDVEESFVIDWYQF